MSHWTEPNHLKQSFIQKWKSDWLYEWVTEPFTQLIHLKQLLFIQEWKKGTVVKLWVSHWTIHSTELFKTVIHLEAKKCLTSWVTHWIIHSTDSLKAIIRYGAKIVIDFMRESLNYLLNRFVLKHRFIKICNSTSAYCLVDFFLLDSFRAIFWA